MRKKTEFKISNYVLNLVFITYSLACLLPLILVFMVSVTDEKALETDGYSFLPAKFSLYAYKYVLSRPEQILRGYGITIFVTIAGTLLSLLLTAMIAYPLSRKTLKYRRQVSFYVYFTMLFNGGLVPWYMLYNNYLHMKNNVLVLIVPYLVGAFNVLILRTFFTTTIPDSIIESAKIDGAGEFTIFFKIIVHLSLPGFATVGLFNTLMYWNDWWLSLLYIDNAKLVNLQYLMLKAMRNLDIMTSSTMVQANVSKAVATMPSETARMAMAIIGIGPIIFAYPFFQRYFIKGLTIGAVKG